jgi:hypothetical protein
MANWEVDVRLPGKGKSNSHGARPVYFIITMIEWIRTSRLSIKNSLWPIGLLGSSSLILKQELQKKIKAIYV